MRTYYTWSRFSLHTGARSASTLLCVISFLILLTPYVALSQTDVPAQIAVVTVVPNNRLHVTANPGHSTKIWPQNVGQSRRSGFLSGDFDGDGPHDVACIDFDGGDVPRAFVTKGPDDPNNNPTNWVRGLRGSEQLTFYFLPGDFNSDGHTDIASFYVPGSGDPNDVRVRITFGPNGVNATSSIQDWNLTGERNSAFVSGLFLGSGTNNDSIHDIAAISYNNAGDFRIRFFQGPNGAHLESENWMIPAIPGANPVAFRTGDFNGDGAGDISAIFFTPSNGSYNARIAFGPDGATIQSRSLGEQPYISILVDDFDGDGFDDIAGITESDNERGATIALGSLGGVRNGGSTNWALPNTDEATGTWLAGRFTQSNIIGKAIDEDGNPLAGVVIDAGAVGIGTTAEDGKVIVGKGFDGMTYTLFASTSVPGPTGLSYHFQPVSKSAMVDGEIIVEFVALRNFDTDGDGEFDHIDSDDDNDGLSDEFEIDMGLDPLNPDTDGDDVDDGQEIVDGSDPLDRGSKGPPLARTLCSDWNGFLGGLWNVKEHVNVSDRTLAIKTTLYTQEGEPRGSETFWLPPGTELDLLIHEMEGWELDAYGKVCSTNVNGAPGDLEGRMTWYKVDPEFSNPENNRFDFAFAMPFINGIKGEQFAMFNTYQPSLDPDDSENVVANWVMINNLEDSVQSGVLTYYNEEGQILGHENAVIASNGRKDFGVHNFGPSLVGLVSWRPTDPEAKFLLRNARYMYDNPHMWDTFDTAYQFDGLVGNGRLLVTPLDTSEASAILEIANTTAFEVSTDVHIYNQSGELRATDRFLLAPYATHHIITDLILNGEKGIATIQGSVVASLVATAMQYGRNSTGGINYIYGVQAREAFGSTLQGNYHSFLRQGCHLLLMNPTSNNESATLSITDSDEGELLLGKVIDVPAHGLTDYNLCQDVPEDAYGIITLVPSEVNSLSAAVLRIGNQSDYRFPTPVRH